MPSGINPINKVQLGELFTPPSLVEEMLDTLPASLFSNPKLRWLDPGCGKGQFSKSVLDRLMVGLEKAFPEKENRRLHITSKMIDMVEINQEHMDTIHSTFGTNCNLIVDDFLGANLGDERYDVVVGNPPYNFNGVKKVPTNNQLEKKSDGITPWIEFVRKSVSLLKPGGYLLFIVPALWMKPDKARMYQFILNYKIECLRAFSNTETNKLFSYSAQTPTCYFLLKKVPSDGVVPIFDKSMGLLVDYDHRPSRPLPIVGASVVSRMKPFLCKAGHLLATKTNMPGKATKFSSAQSTEFSFPYIKTCILEDGGPRLKIEYGDRPDKFRGRTKLVLAHKMYGFPYLDRNGEMGISNRDNYVISEYSHGDLERIQAFLSTCFALFIYDCTRYRMKYLEKYAFELLPDITRLEDFPECIDDASVMEYFGLSDGEREAVVASLGKRKYDFNHPDY
jgi:hypothetical protein